MDNKEAILGIIAVVVVAGAICGLLLVENNSSDTTYTVTYDPNYNGAPEPVVMSYENGTEINYPVNPIRFDYKVSGWYFDKECTKEVLFPYKVTSNVTLYADWDQFDLSELIQDNFLTTTAFGQYLVSLNTTTTGFDDITIGTTEPAKTYFYSSGREHLVFKTADSYYVASVIGGGTSFYISAQGIIDNSLKSKSLAECNVEFIIYQKDVDNVRYYYAQSLDGTQPPIKSTTMPEIVMNRYVVMSEKDADGKEHYYRYDFIYEGEKKGRFDVNNKVEVNPDHTPSNGSSTATSFCELVKSLSLTGDISYNAYILDSKFNVLQSYNVPDNAHRVVLLYLSGDSYLLQYSTVTTSYDDCTYIEKNVKYKLHSFIVGTGGSTPVDLDYPAFTTSNLSMRLSYLSILKADIKNVVSFYTIDSNKNLDTTSKILVALNADGTISKECSYTNGAYSLEFFTPTTFDGAHYLFMSGVVDGKRNVVCNIIDNMGNPLLTNVVYGTNSYYVTNNPGDYNIYKLITVEGRAVTDVVGNYMGKTLVGHTNNLLFFTDSDGKLYVFGQDGVNFTEIDDYAGDLVCKNGCYGYRSTDYELKYAYFTEDGTFIVSSNYNEVTDRTAINSTGAKVVGYYIEQFYLGNGEYKIVKLTTS